jgi:GAF domain-containing protein
MLFDEPDNPRWKLLSAAEDRLHQAPDVQSVIEVVRSAARGIFSADGVTFVLREGDLCHYVEEDAIAPLWKGQRFPMSACISGWSMLHGQTVAIEDVFTDPRIPHDAYRRTFVKSLIMTPISPPWREAPEGGDTRSVATAYGRLSGQRRERGENKLAPSPVAAIGAYWRERKHFKEREISVVKTLAAAVGGVLNGFLET